MQLSFTPTLDRQETRRRLDQLLVADPLRDPALTRRIERLSRAFQSFAASYSLPLWAPGLIVDHEMRGLSEALFPLAQVSAVFELVLRRGCRFPPLFAGSYLRSSACWFDLLQRMGPPLSSADPATALRELAEDADKRAAFLFALMLPQHFGGAFDRYPQQSQWVKGWLKDNASRLGGRVRALDSACGSGEGTYGLVELVLEAGLALPGSAVHGSTIEPCELFAGAHAFFPHDPQREESYRARVAPLLEEAQGVSLEFYLDEVGSANGREGYDLILCNGLLGGPLLHEPGGLSAAIGALARRLAPGGVLLAADRFHAGWRLKVPARALRALLREHGLTPLEVPEGVAGAKGV